MTHHLLRTKRLWNKMEEGMEAARGYAIVYGMLQRRMNGVVETWKHAVNDAQNRSMQLSWLGQVGVTSTRNHGVVPGLAVAHTHIQDASVLIPCGLGKRVEGGGGLAQPSEVDRLNDARPGSVPIAGCVCVGVWLRGVHLIVRDVGQVCPR